jgi:hypothetical protein
MRNTGIEKRAANAAAVISPARRRNVPTIGTSCLSAVARDRMKTLASADLRESMARLLSNLAKSPKWPGR